MKRKEVGELGEKVARNYLKKKGYSILETNFRCKYGEIDIVTKKNESLVFVEVRTKTGSNFGSPEESVTRSKKEKLIASAYSYLNTHQFINSTWRIDFVAVELDQCGKANRIELFENAVS
jgi:putative endonuclease